MVTRVPPHGGLTRNAYGTSRCGCEDCDLYYRWEPVADELTDAAILHYDDGQELRRGDYVYDTKRDARFIVWDAAARYDEVEMVTQLGDSIYADIGDLELLQRGESHV